MRFTIRGINFDLLPSNLVAFFQSSLINSTVTYHTMSEVERGGDYVIFETNVEHNFTESHVWQFFGSPSEPPRTLVEYVAI